MRLYSLVLLGLVLAGSARADVFEHYTNRVLDKLLEGKNAFVVVRTNEGRLAKLLVQAAKQKVGNDAVRILSIEQFVTYKEGEERQVVVSGKNQSLYPGFRFSLDLGQVVPEAVGGDVRFVIDSDKVYAEPLGKAKLYLVTKHDPAVVPRKPGKFVMGERFDPKYFTGTFKLYDDGRRSGKLTLKVDNGDVTGSYYSDKDGSKYDVKGKIGEPRHSIEFTIVLPRTEQVFKGMLFTGDGKAMAGTSKLANRESAFYAVREE
jgi:hypothetical protein